MRQEDCLHTYFLDKCEKSSKLRIDAWKREMTTAHLLTCGWNVRNSSRLSKNWCPQMRVETEEDSGCTPPYPSTEPSWFPTSFTWRWLLRKLKPNKSGTERQKIVVGETQQSSRVRTTEPSSMIKLRSIQQQLITNEDTGCSGPHQISQLRGPKFGIMSSKHHPRPHCLQIHCN